MQQQDFDIHSTLDIEGMACLMNDHKNVRQMNSINEWFKYRHTQRGIELFKIGGSYII